MKVEQYNIFCPVLKFMKKIFFLWVIFFSFSVQAGAAAVKNPNFAFSPAWLAMVHYRPQLWGGYEGTIDSETFYLAPEGRTSPQAELEATVALFEQGQDTGKICFFPARYRLLKQQGLVKAAFPHCPEYEQFVADLQPAGVTLLFTDAYMNNPSSLFGHTLIRVDTARKGTQLLAHGMNYGAFTGENPGPLYALLGLTGGYYGGFTVKPYYDIINTYNNIENRDIWEFNLDFSAEEREMFVAHLWEVGHTQTRYYFFSQNCSYMLMEMLDAVRPELKLADDFPAQAIPLDTVKQAAKRSGLVASVNYRPSRQNKLIHQYRQMNAPQRQAFRQAIKEHDFAMPGLDESEKAGVAEAAYRYIQYQNVAGDISREDYRSGSFKLLQARSNIKAQDNFKPLTDGKSPLKSHASKRASFGAGVRNGQSFQEIQLRPAYHSLTDNAYGLLPGAEINFLNVKARHYDRDKAYVLQDFDILSIKSLSPVNVMFMPYSYNISFGINRELNPQTGDEGYVANLMAGAGFSYEMAEGVSVYAMLNNHAAYGGFLPHNQYLGLGAAGGIYVTRGDFRLLAEAEQVWATTNYGSKIKYNLEAAYAMSTNTALSLQYKYEQNRGRYDVDETMAALRLYF